MVTFIFAIVAIAVLWKLWLVLGTRQGSEPKINNPFENPTSNKFKTTSILTPPEKLPTDQNGQRWAPYVEDGSAVALRLDAIAARDPKFSLSTFMQGATAAYELISQAFVKGDKNSLRPLVSDEVYQGFVQIIDQREARQETNSLTFVSIETPKVLDALLQDALVELVIGFHAKIISAVYDKEGKVTSGSKDSVTDSETIWTFMRDVRSKDPNWILISTHN